jgi:hypothetical protein
VANAAEQAELSLSQARRKQQDDTEERHHQRHRCHQEAGGWRQEALKGINPSVDNLVKGIVGAAGESAHAIGDLKGDITDLSSPAPSAKQALETLSKALSNLDDNSTKMAVAARFLGRTITQDFLNVLSNPEKLKEFQERVEHLGLALNDTDKQISEKFRESLFTLQNDIGLVADKIGTAFGPGFTQILQALDAALIGNKDSILAFANDIAGKAVPVIESFIRVLSGAPDAVKDQWLVDYTTKIGEFGSAVGRLGGIFAQAVGAIVQAAEGIASAINGIFGSNLNGFDVLLGAWVASIVHHFAKVIQAATLAATGIQVALAPVLAFMAVIASAVYVVVKAFTALSDAFGLEGQSSHLDAMLEGMQERLKGIAQIMSGDFSKGMETIKAANAKQAEAEKGLDDVDKQIAENKKKRQQELLQTSSDVNHKTTEDQKTALDEQDKDHKASVDNRLADLKRLETEAHNSAEKQKSDNAEAAKAAQTAQQPKTTQSSQAQPVSTSNPKDGSITDSAGTRIFPGGSGNGDSIQGTTFAQGAEAAAKKLGTVLSDIVATVSNDGSGFGRLNFDAWSKGASGLMQPGLADNRASANSGANVIRVQPSDIESAVKAGAEKGTSTGAKEFNQSIAKQGGFPTPDRATYSPPVSGAYDKNGNFVPNKVQPSPLPAADQPKSVDTSSQAYKAQEDTMAKAVERGNLAAAQKEQALPNSDSLNHARNGFGPTDIPPGGIENLPPTPGAFPTPPEQVPLAPELQPFKDLTDIGDKLTGVFDNIGNTLKSAFDSVVNQKSPVEGQGLTDTTFENLKQGLDTLTNALTTKSQQEQQQAPQSDTAPPPVQDLSELGSSASEAGTQLATLDGAASAAAEALSSLQTAAATAAAGGGGGGGGSADVTPIAAAGGGHIWGPGTETSDSIPALLSKNEFVHPAYAVRHYGLQFMEDIRHLRVPKFNMGGLVGLLSPQLPRFSAGGSVSATTGGPATAPVPVDLRTDHGTVRVAASKGALGQLQRAAATKRMTSTTQRRPEFVS